MAAIRERQGKNGPRYTAEVRWSGQRRSATFGTKTAAKTWAKKIESDISDGKHTPNAEAKRRTVRDMLERYKEFEIPKKKDQINTLRQVNFWIAELGSTKLYSLSRAAIVQVRDKLAKDKAPATVNRYLAALSHACTCAEREWEWMPTNPLRKVKRLRESRGRVRYLSDGERKALLEATATSDHPHLHAIVLLALTSGARRSEILGLTWKDVNLARQRAILHDTKNSESRALTLVPHVIVELKKIKKVRRLDTNRIFINPTGKLREGGYNRSGYFYFEKAWHDAMTKAKIEDFRFHDLRHSAASYLAMNGATTAEIAAVLGHKTLQMVKRYAHLSDNHVQDIVQRTAEKILGD